MRSLLSVLAAAFQTLNYIFERIKTNRLKRQGKEELKQEIDAAADKQLGEAHEIDTKVNQGTLTDDDLERLSRFERESR